MADQDKSKSRAPLTDREKREKAEKEKAERHDRLKESAKRLETKIAGLQTDPKRFISPLLQAGSPPSLAKLPKLADMVNLSDLELIDTLQKYGVVSSWEEQQQKALDTVLPALRNAPVGSEQFWNTLNSTVDVNSRRELLGMTRRTSQQWSALTAIDGNLNQDMVWITVGDSESCDPCNERGGMEATYTEWQEIGGPGVPCLGGDYCRCELVKIT